MIQKAKKPKNVIIKYPGDIPTYYGDCPLCGVQCKPLSIDKYLCVVCKMSKEYDCKGCGYEEVEDWKDPCRICRRNQKDYYRKAAE